MDLITFSDVYCQSPSKAFKLAEAIFVIFHKMYFLQSPTLSPPPTELREFLIKGNNVTFPLLTPETSEDNIKNVEKPSIVIFSYRV